MLNNYGVDNLVEGYSFVYQLCYNVYASWYTEIWVLCAVQWKRGFKFLLSVFSALQGEVCCLNWDSAKNNAITFSSNKCPDSKYD